MSNIIDPVIVSLLIVHWLADFVLQTHWQAQNKSKNNYALLAHVATYTLALTGFSICMVSTEYDLHGWFLFVVVNGSLHFITDWGTSRWSAKYFGKDWHTFFVVVGFDQLIHQVTLIQTAHYLLVN